MRVRALIIKEFYQMIRDPSCFLVSIVLPLMLLFLYGYAVSLDMKNLKLGLLLEDRSPDALSLAQAVIHSSYFDVQTITNREELKDKITSGAVRGVVVIPSYFSTFRNRPDMVAPVQVITDGSEPNTASFVQNYFRGIFNNWIQQETIDRKTPPLAFVTPQIRFWYNQELESRNFLIPGSIAIIMTLIGTLLTSLVVAREWERGTMESLMTTPITIKELLIGKLVPYFCLGMISMTLCFLIAVLYYDVPFRGSFVTLFVVASFYLISALTLGLLISTISKNQFLAAQAAIVLGFFPGFILSGFLFENSSMPILIQLFTYILPVKYFVTILQSLFLVGDIWKLIIINIVPIWILTSILLFFTLKKTVKRLE